MKYILSLLLFINSAFCDVYDVTQAPYNAPCNGTGDDTTEIQDAIDDAETAGGGTVYFPASAHCMTTGNTVTKGITYFCEGWSTTIENYDDIGHTIYKAAGLSLASEALKIEGCHIKHTGGGSYDAIHLEELNNHLRIERVKISDAPRYGIYISGIETSSRASLYSYLDQVYVEGALTHGIYLNGAVNNATIIGGRLGSNGVCGLKLDDTLTGSPSSYPNTLRLVGTDIAGNYDGICDSGHSDYYSGARFEGNTHCDISFGSDSQSAIFLGSAYSSTPIICGTPAARPLFLDKHFFLRFFQDNGFLEYYDEWFGVTRKLPKRPIFPGYITATAQGSGIVDWGTSTVKDNIKVVRVSFIPSANITGANTNYFRICLRTKKVDNSDNAIACQSFTSGVNWTAKNSYSLSIDTNQDDRIEGDRLYVEKDEYGTGMASPHMGYEVEYQ